MSFDLTSYMTSNLCELISGNGRSFFIHRDLLAYRSSEFRANLVHWDGVAVRLTGWDDDTVRHLVEFLYTENYRYPDPDPWDEEAGPLTEGQSVAQTPEAGDKYRELTPFEDWQPPQHSPRTELRQSNSSGLESFDPAKCDFSRALLCHARVYSLAQRATVWSLCHLALENMNTVLSYLKPLQEGSHHVSDIADLVSYVYSNTTQPLTSPEPLRDRVSRFVALNIRVFQSHRTGAELVEKGGDFVRDVMAHVSRLVPSTPRASTTKPPVTQRRSSTPRAAPPVVKAEGIYVCGVTVKYCKDPPLDCVKAVAGGVSSNLNHPLPEGVWLIPEYSTVPQEGCTSFQVLPTRSSREAQKIKLGLGMCCYLHPFTMPGGDKIKEVALVHTRSGGDKRRNLPRGYHGISEDIKRGEGGPDALYLVWKSVTLA